MKKQTFRIVPAKASQQVFILVREESADEDGVINVRAGFLEVEPEKANSLLAKLESGERTVIVGSMNPANGNHEIRVAPKAAATTPAPAGELKH